ncbi:MAG: hypothetical protein ABSA53_15530, partial [Streptosporangiaceae bacterium]
APGTPVGAVSGAAGPTATLTRADGTQPAQGARYAVRVQAVVAGNLGPWATSAPLIVVTLPPPTGVVLQVAGAGFSLTWTAPALPSLLTGPVSYDVALMQGGVPVGTLTGVTGTSAAPSRGDNQTPAAGQAYTAQVRAATPGHASGWAAAAPVIVMDVPQIISASYASGVTRVQWTPSAVPGADYDVDVHQQEVAPGADRVTPVAGPATSASIDMTGLPSWTYNVTVRARTANSVGAWSTAVPIALIDPPAIDAVTYAGTVVTVQFNGNTNARTGFRFTLFRPDGTTAGSWTTSGQMGEYFTTVPAGLVQPGITYTLTAVTLFGAYTSIPSAPVPVALLPLPSAVTLTAMGTVFSLTWTAAPLTGPVSYTVVLMQGSTSVGELDQVTGTSAVPARTDQQIPATGQVYTAKVRTVQNGNTSDWAISAPVTIMDAPSVTSAAYAGGTATVQWTPSSVAGAGYLVTLQQQGAVAGTVPPVTVPGPATSARIDLTGRPNGMYSAAVRATTPGSAGPPSPSAAFAVLDPPGGLAVRYAGTQVTVSWTAAPAGSRFDTYQLTLTGPDGKTTGWRAPSTATSFRLPLGAVQPGTSYSLTAATTVGRYTSALSAAIPVALLAPPTAVTLTATGPAFSLTWTAAQLTGPVSYTVILTQDGTQVAELDQVTGTTAAPTRTDKQAPAAGQVYTASVWAVQDGNTSPSAVSAPVTVMDIPSITSASYPGGVVTVKWTASTITGAGYNVKLQQQDVADGAHVQTAVSQNSVGIDMSGHPRLIYTATVQATMVNSVGTWSAPVPVPVLDPPTGLNVTSLKNSNTVNASWNALPAGSQISFYLLTLRSQSGSGMSAWQVAPPTTTFQIPPSAFQSPLPYTLTVATRAGIYTSMSSPPITVIPPNPAASG